MVLQSTFVLSSNIHKRIDGFCKFRRNTSSGFGVGADRDETMGKIIQRDFSTYNTGRSCNERKMMRPALCRPFFLGFEIKGRGKPAGGTSASFYRKLGGRGMREWPVIRLRCRRKKETPRRKTVKRAHKQTRMRRSACRGHCRKNEIRFPAARTAARRVGPQGFSLRALRQTARALPISATRRREGGRAGIAPVSLLRY